MNVETNSNSYSADAVAKTRVEALTTFGRPRRIPDLGLSRSNTMRFFNGFSIVILAFAMAWPFLPRRYEATTTIIFHQTDLESPSDSAQFMRQPLDESAMQSEIDQIAAPTIAAVVLAQHSLAADPEFNGGWNSWFGLSGASDADLRQRLLARLSVSKDRRSYTVKFGFMSSDPVKAAALTDTLLKAYLADQLARKRKTIDNLTGLLTEQVDMLRTKSDASQLAVKNFLDQSGLIDTGATISLEHELLTLSTEAAMAKSRTTEAQARADALTSLQKAGKLDSAPEVLASPFVQMLKEKMAGSKSAVSPVGIPQRAIDEQILAEADRIALSVKTEARISMEREAALQRAIDTIRQEMVRRDESELHLAVLRRRVVRQESARYCSGAPCRSDRTGKFGRP
jgi:polysaccharide biosynthesis transport protein